MSFTKTMETIGKIFFLILLTCFLLAFIALGIGAMLRAVKWAF